MEEILEEIRDKIHDPVLCPIEFVYLGKLTLFGEIELDYISKNNDYWDLVDRILGGYYRYYTQLYNARILFPDWDYSFDD